jgi:hypothetical protein
VLEHVIDSTIKIDHTPLKNSWQLAVVSCQWVSIDASVRHTANCQLTTEI